MTKMRKTNRHVHKHNKENRRLSNTNPINTGDDLRWSGMVAEPAPHMTSAMLLVLLQFL